MAIGAARLSLIKQAQHEVNGRTRTTRQRLSYLRHHHLALLALFLASGGVSYAAVKLPANSVTTRQVKDFSLLQRDFKRGQVPRGAPGPSGAPGSAGPTMGAVAGSAATPPTEPDKLWESVAPTTAVAGKLFVIAHVESATLTCAGSDPCSVDLGLYVDDKPVGQTDRVLTSGCSTSCQIHVPEQDLFGIAADVASGAHSVQLCSKTRTGMVTDLSGKIGEVGAVLLGT